MVNRCIFSKDDFRIYAMNVDTNLYETIKLNQYGNVSIMGNLSDLDYNVPYKITATETKGKYGITYKVISCNRNKPASSKETHLFLRTILTKKQADALYVEYPNIIDMVLNDEPIDLSVVKSIGEKSFKRIRDKIIADFKLIGLINEFKGMLSITVLRKLYEKYPSIEVVRKKVLDDPYTFLCDLSGIGFKTADEMLLNFQKNETVDFGYDLKASKQRCVSCITYLLKENENNGSTKLELATLLKQVKEMMPECSEHLVECVKDEKFYYHVDENNIPYISIRDTYETEKYIYDRIMEAMSCSEVYECDYKNYAKIGDSALTETQQNALKNLCENQFSILVGYSGTGKSFSVQAIISMLQDLGKSYKIFAPTGKAAKVVGNYTGVDAQTIHRGLGYIPPDWTYNENRKLLCDVLIIDEISMTDIFLFKRVLAAINFSTTKLLIIGDPAQLPSVACGNLLHDLLSIKEIPCTKLTEVFRYGDGGLMKVATDVRNSVQYLTEQKENKEKMKAYGTNKDYTFINANKDEGLKYLITIYKKVLETYKTNEVTVLSCYKKGDYGCVRLNEFLQPLANPHDVNDVHITVKGQSYYIGDIVMQKINNRDGCAVTEEEQFGFMEWTPYEEGIFIANGETGEIIDIKNDEVIINFNGINIRYTREDMQNIVLAYAYTVHSSQGSQNKIIILFTPSSHAYMLNSNIIYVGLTRMQEKVFHIGDLNTVNRAILKKENFERNTWLKEFKNN